MLCDDDDYGKMNIKNFGMFLGKFGLEKVVRNSQKIR
jgi:hypothetical protein